MRLKTIQSVKRALPALLLAVLLGACTQRETAQREAAQPVKEGPAPVEARTDVENNGGSYVRVGERVFFRRYGQDALQSAAVFGEFTSPWNSRSGESELVALDLMTGKTEVVCTETGTGSLWYGDGGFYLDEQINGGHRVVWCASDGGAMEELCAGQPLGLTENGLLAVQSVVRSPSYRTVFSFYRNKALVSETDFAYDYIYAGLSEQGLFLLGGDPSRDSEALCVWQLTPEGGLLRLGVMPETAEPDALYDIQADGFLAAGDTVVLCVGYYAGSGHFLNECAIVEADIGRENSLRPLAPASSEIGEDGLPRLTVGEDGAAALAPVLPGELRIGWEDANDGDLELWEDGAWHTLRRDFCPSPSDGSGCRRIVQHMDYVDGAAYVTLACAHASPIDSIGWRDAYMLLDMLYLRIDRSGAEQELCAVDHGAELYGNVWLLRGTDTLLWQQLNSEDDGWFEAGPAYMIPCTNETEWLGGMESVFSGDDGLLPPDYGKDEAGGYGCPAPETKAAASVCLTLDRNGTAVSVVRKDPAALLDIRFDVPETAGAKDTLRLERRASDEDTPWFWAKLTALENGVRLRIDRTSAQESLVEELAGINGAFIVGETPYDGILNRGEYVLVRASLPWHPELRVSVSKDGRFGSYVFGEDNYLHLETEDNIHPALTLAAYPMPDIRDYSEEVQRAALQGTWLYTSPLTGKPAALLYFDEENNVMVETGEKSCWFRTALDRLYSGEWDAPDLLRLSTAEEDAVRSEGDYLTQLFRTDGEELLMLTQANNGDGVLSTLLPGAEEPWTTSFTFRRWNGTGQAGAVRRAAAFPAIVVRRDRASGCLWLQEAEKADEYPDGGIVWRANPDAPCLPYPIAGEDVVLSLREGPDADYPMRIYTVSVNRNGEVERIAAQD